MILPPTTFEMLCYNLRAEGRQFKEIAAITGHPYGSVINAKRVAKIKLAGSVKPVQRKQVSEYDERFGTKRCRRCHLLMPCSPGYNKCMAREDFFNLHIHGIGMLYRAIAALPEQ